MKDRKEFDAHLDAMLRIKARTLTETAQNIGMSVANLSRIKRNGNPTYKIIKSLANALDVAPGEFFGNYR